MNDQQMLVRLKSELQFLKDGGYASIFWRPYAVFEESLLCINPRHTNRPVACQECRLIDFVPESKKQEQIPCRHIRLNGFGLTPRQLPEWGTKQQIEQVMREWLEARITELESKLQSQPAPQQTSAPVL